MEAAAWLQLGRVYHEQRQWDEAERHYREAARISAERGHLAAAAQTWNQLAVLTQEAGKPETAEGWYRKALEVDRQIGNPTQLGHRLNNLADLLQNQTCCRTNRVASSTLDNWPRRHCRNHCDV
jgi:tetratricopeptide (TPR) repeat protein